MKDKNMLGNLRFPTHRKSQGFSSVFWKIAQIAGYVVLLAVVVFLISQNTSRNETWECGQTVCTSLMTQRAIVDRFCSMDERQKFQCSLNIDGRPAVVPLDSLNLSSIQVCSEFTCVKEVMVRPANYTVNAGMR